MTNEQLKEIKAGKHERIRKLLNNMRVTQPVVEDPRPRGAVVEIHHYDRSPDPNKRG